MAIGQQPVTPEQGVPVSVTTPGQEMSQAEVPASSAMPEPPESPEPVASTPAPVAPVPETANPNVSEEAQAVPTALTGEPLGMAEETPPVPVTPPSMAEEPVAPVAAEAMQEQTPVPDTVGLPDDTAARIKANDHSGMEADLAVKNVTDPSANIPPPAPGTPVKQENLGQVANGDAQPAESTDQAPPPPPAREITADTPTAPAEYTEPVAQDGQKPPAEPAFVSQDPLAPVHKATERINDTAERSSAETDGVEAARIIAELPPVARKSALAMLRGLVAETEGKKIK